MTLLTHKILKNFKNLRNPRKPKLDMAIKIVTDLSGDFDITEFEDTYMKRVEEIIAQKIKGEKIHIEKPPQVEAKASWLHCGKHSSSWKPNEPPYLQADACQSCRRRLHRKDWIFEIKWDGFRAISLRRRQPQH